MDISISDLLHCPLENQAGTSTPKTKSYPIVDEINTSRSQSSNLQPSLTITIPAESQIDVYVCIYIFLHISACLNANFLVTQYNYFTEDV